MYHIQEITDCLSESLNVYARLTENQIRNKADPANGLFIAESPLIIRRALEKGYQPYSLLLGKEYINNKYEDILVRCSDVPIYTAEHNVLETITGYKLTRGMLCAMFRPAVMTSIDLLQNSKKIAVMENVVNPTNVGAIFRSAAALGIDSVILTSDCADPLYRRAVRVSMGAVFQIPWSYVDNDIDVIEFVHKYGFKSVAMALERNSISIKDDALKKADKLAILLGGEGYGLKRETIDNSDYVAMIPMKNNVDSLNVAAAASVIFWQLCN